MDRPLIAALAVDHTGLADSHFGDAPRYVLVRLNPTGTEALGEVNNTSEHEAHGAHGDPHKARQIIQILRQRGVQVMVGRQFGANLPRVVKRFAVVLVGAADVESTLRDLTARYSDILSAADAGEARTVINLR